MDWQKELDELKRREEFAERLADPSASSASTTVDATPSASESPGWSTPAPSRARQDRRPGVLRRAQRPRGPDASNFILAGEGRGAPRRGRRDDFTVRGGSATRHQGQAQHVRADGERAEAALIRLVEGSGGGGSVTTRFQPSTAGTLARPVVRWS